LAAEKMRADSVPVNSQLRYCNHDLQVCFSLVSSLAGRWLRASVQAAAGFSRI